jgi:D-amino peptidase
MRNNGAVHPFLKVDISRPSAFGRRGARVKVFMHWDMEGVSGLMTREQVWYWEPGVRAEVAAEGRRLLMADVESAAAAALASGADELIVCDTHHGGGNLELDRMPRDPRITYLGRSVGEQDGRRRWMPGLDRGVDALMLPGHHAKAGTARAFLPHTWSSQWADFQINGRSVGEIGIEACYAGHWDVPLILVQGDEAGCQEAAEQFPGVVTASVKRALGRDLCEGLDEEAARRLTGERVAEAIAALRGGRAAPYKPRLPMAVTVRMHTAEAAERAASRPTVRRLDELTVEGRVDQQCDVVKWLLGTGLDMPPEQP